MCVVLVVVGMLAAVSLLVRHWRSIEAAAALPEDAEKALPPARVPLLPEVRILHRFLLAPGSP